MAQQTSAAASSLRALTYRITSTPTKELPQIAPQIASSIWSCRDLLSLPAETKQSSETTTLAHRFKTLLSTLLQDRSVEGRWSAVVLTKATIEAGRLETLAKSNSWVKNLLAILKRPDPPSMRSLVVLTLTRIFTLTWEYSNLIREITTPALTAFVPTCISNIEHQRCSSGELQTVLEAFATLIPRHPTIFRTNEAKLRHILTSIISSSSGNPAGRRFTASHRASATKLLVLLHHCAPKQGGSEKWIETLRSGIEAGHSTCDRIFRCVHEDRQPTTGMQPSIAAQQLLKGELEVESIDAIGLKPWKGVYAGAERLISLLELITSHLSSPTSATVTIRVGIIADLLTRIFGVVVPRSGKQGFVKINNQIPRDEREALFAVLPRIHIAASQTSRALLERLGSAVVSSISILLDQLMFVFGAESANTDLRQAIYENFIVLLHLCGPSLTKNEVAEIAPIARACCQDLLPAGEASNSTKTNDSTGSINKQLGLAGGQSVQSDAVNLPELTSAARGLLRTVVLKFDATMLSPSLRAQIDRTAVLTKDKHIMLASVMTPPKRAGDARVQASLLPILARHFANEPDVECLLRPRLPPIRTHGVESANGFDNDEMDVEEDEDEEIGVESEEEAEAPEAVQQESPSAQLNDQLLNYEEVKAGASESAPAKRRAADDEPSEVTAKRMRATDVAASLLPERDASLRGPEPTTISTSVTVVKPPAATSEPSRATTNPVTRATASAQDDEDDDSDGEIPALTMDQDTDPEDED